jgi:hypothetical protein
MQDIRAFPDMQSLVHVSRERLKFIVFICMALEECHHDLVATLTKYM